MRRLWIWLVGTLLVVSVAATGIGRGAAAQEATPVAGGNPVGTWLVRETLPPAGVEPPLFFVVTFFADGNAVATSFIDGRTTQGVWVDDPSGAVTFTLVGPVSGGNGIAPDAVGRLRATVEVAGDALTGGYTVETLDGDLATPVFTYNGPVAGQRIEAQGPDPVALQVAEEARAGATPTP